MPVKVKFLGNLKQLVEDGQTSVSADTVGDLLDDLVEKHPQLLSKIFENPSDRKLKGSINLLVNGQRIDSLRGFETEIADGDKVVFFPPVGGG